METRRRALLIGRFQPPHLGHLHAIRYVLSVSDEIIIGIGSAQYSHTVKNPFTAGERVEMLLLMLSEAHIPRDRFLLIPIPDAPAHAQWVSIVESFCPRFHVVFTNDALSNTLLSEAGYEVRPIPLLRREVLSGTEVRKRMATGRNWEELVSPSVASYLRVNRLVDRVRQLSAQLKASA